MSCNILSDVPGCHDENIQKYNNQNAPARVEIEDFDVDTKQKKKTWAEMSAWDRFVFIVYFQFPMMNWIQTYSLKDGFGDFISGITVGVLTIPKCLAYAKSAGLPQQYGLYSSWLCPMVYCVFGTSRHVKVGPTALLCLLIINQTNGDIAATIAITMLSGLMQLFCGYIRVGALVEFISHPVIEGFASSAGFTIIVGQLKDFFGGLKFRTPFYYQLDDLFINLPNITGGDTGLSIVCLSYLLFCGHVHRLFKNPSPRMRTLIGVLGLSKNAVVCVVATIISYALYKRYPGASIPWKIVGTIPTGLPSSVLGDSTFNYQMTHNLSSILVSSVIVAVVSYLENIAIAQTYARQEGTLHTLDANQELVALGWTNFLTSFVGSFPVTGSFSCTVVNHQAGVRTQLSGFLIGGIVLLAMFELTPAFYYIPNPVLASIVINAALSLIDFRIVREMYSLGRAGIPDMITWLFAFFGCLFFDIQYGMSVAIAVSLFIQLYEHARPNVSAVTVELNNGTSSLLAHPKGASDLERDIAEQSALSALRNRNNENSSSSSSSSASSSLLASFFNPSIIILRVEGSIVFSSVSHIQKSIQQLEAEMRGAIKEKQGVRSSSIMTPSLQARMNDDNSINNHNVKKSNAVDDGDKRDVEYSQVTIHDDEAKSNAVTARDSYDDNVNDNDNDNDKQTESGNVAVTARALSDTHTQGLGQAQSQSSIPLMSSVSGSPTKFRILDGIILDFTPVNYIDVSGLRTLFEMYAEYSSRRSPLFIQFVGCRERIRNSIEIFFNAKLPKNPDQPNIKDSFHTSTTAAILSMSK